MNKLVEALRRMLVIVAWSPTAIVIGIVFFNMSDAANAVDEVIIMAGYCAIGGLVAHLIINWIFQVEKSATLTASIDQAENDSDNRPLTAEAYMEKNRLWQQLIFLVWCLGLIWLGNSRNGYPFPYWGMWSSMDNFLNYYSVLWPYYVVGFGGLFLSLYLVKRNYERYLKRLGY